MANLFTHFATTVARWAGKPTSFALAAFIIVVWAALGPAFGYSDTWQLVINTGTTIVTFLMVFLIQNSQNRDGAAIQSKLDEIIRSIDGARNEFIGIEHLTEDELEEIRAACEQAVAEAHVEGGRRDSAIERLRASFARMAEGR
jgi:low affinity Fe/Cu permease